MTNEIGRALPRLTGDEAPCPHLCYCERRNNLAEIARLKEAKRCAGLIADERSRENVALRAAVDELRTQEGIVKRDAEIERLRAALKQIAQGSEDVEACAIAWGALMKMKAAPLEQGETKDG